MNDILLVSICTILLPILIFALIIFFAETNIGKKILPILLHLIITLLFLAGIFLVFYSAFVDFGWIEPFLEPFLN